MGIASWPINTLRPLGPKGGKGRPREGGAGTNVFRQRIILPNIMAEITDTITMAMEACALWDSLCNFQTGRRTCQIGNLPLPAGGFFPSVVTAELQPYFAVA